MGKTRYPIRTAIGCFRTWRSGPRILTILGVIVCFSIIYAVPFGENARAQGEALQVAEAFIAMMNWRFTMLLFSSAILLLFGDLPIIEPVTFSALIKGSRRGWIVGQILYVIVASFIMGLLIFGVSIIVSLPKASFLNEWSRPVKLLANSGRIAISPERMRLMLPQSIVAEYLPWQAFAHSFILFFLTCCFYGLASLTLRMKWKTASFTLLMMINTISWASGMFTINSKAYAVLSMISIHFHASLFMHEAASANDLLPTLGTSYIVLVIGVIMLMLVAILLVRKYDYLQSEVEYK